MKIDKKLVYALFLALMVFWTGVVVYYERISSNDRIVITRIIEENIQTKNDISDEEYISVYLYYYNVKKDTDSSGNILCDTQAILPVERKISKTNTPLEDTLKLLLKGQLEKNEIDKGYKTEFPLDGVTIKDIALSEDGLLKINLSDPFKKTVGGSCRTAILANQILKTVKQFSVVREVEFVDTELFQP